MTDAEESSMLEPVVPTKQPTNNSKSNAKRIAALKGKRVEKHAEEPDQEIEQRIQYAGDRTVDHHLWELLPSEMVRDAGYKGSPMLSDVMHQHFFHNITSNGEPKDVCSPVGGHYHDIQILPAKNGMVPKIVVGAAYQLLQKKVGANYKTYKAPLSFVNDEGEPLVDDHTHKARYYGSQKVMVRQVNIEAVKVQTNAESQGRSISGIIG